MEEYKLLNKKKRREKKDSSFKKIFFSMINRVLLCVLLFLVALILTKNKVYKEQIYKYVYSYQFPFMELEQIYEKYFGKLLPDVNHEKKGGETMVSSSVMTYEELEEIPDGVRLKVGKGNVVSAVESGLVLFVGEKDGYGTTLVLEQVDGNEAWYVGVDVHDIELYDYIEKESIVGSSKDEYISMYFKRKGESIDYKNYLS